MFSSYFLLQSFFQFCQLCNYITFLVYLLPQSYNQPFLCKTWFLLLENGIRNQELGTWCAYCGWGVFIISFIGVDLEIPKKNGGNGRGQKQLWSDCGLRGLCLGSVSSIPLHFGNVFLSDIFCEVVYFPGLSHESFI